MSDVMPVMAIDSWPTNAALIADVHRVGYIRAADRVLDPTWGRGTWWKKWRPVDLTGSDLDPEKSPSGESVDFTALPWPDETFDVVAYDPPYKLNGTPDPSIDERYGVHVRASWQNRMALCLDGLVECVRVVRSGGHVLAKCQDQVVSGHVRWQTDEFTRAAEAAGCVKVDRFDMKSYRPQPSERTCSTCKGLGVMGDLGKCGECGATGVVPTRQIHARRNCSSLLVFVRL